MQSKLIKRILFFLVMAAYLVVPLYLITRYNKVLSEGHVYRFRPQPVDPYDAFRGKYVTLAFMDQTVDYDTLKYHFNRGDDVYVNVEVDSNGYGIFTKAFAEPPSEGDYIKTVVRDEWHGANNSWMFGTAEKINGRITIDLPFTKYYLPEEMAPKAEKFYFENVRRVGETTDSVYVDVRIHDGKALIEELYFQGMPVKEFIHKHESDKVESN